MYGSSSSAVLNRSIYPSRQALHLSNILCNAKEGDTPLMPAARRAKIFLKPGIFMKIFMKNSIRITQCSAKHLSNNEALVQSALIIPCHSKVVLFMQSLQQPQLIESISLDTETAQHAHNTHRSLNSLPVYLPSLQTNMYPST